MAGGAGDAAARAFDAESAVGYDRHVRAGVVGYEALHDAATALLGIELGPSARLLAVGAGTGEELLRLARLRPGWRFVGVDPSAPMLAIARRRLEEAGLGDRVDLVEGTASTLPPGPPFDAATLLLVMHFLPDDGSKLALLRSVAELLRPGAPLVLADLHGDPASPAFGTLLAAWRQRMLDAGSTPEDVAAGFASVREQIVFVPEARIAALLREAGFGEPLPFWRGLLFGGWQVRRTGG